MQCGVEEMELGTEGRYLCSTPTHAVAPPRCGQAVTASSSSPSPCSTGDATPKVWPINTRKVGGGCCERRRPHQAGLVKMGRLNVEPLVGDAEQCEELTAMPGHGPEQRERAARRGGVGDIVVFTKVIHH